LPNFSATVSVTLKTTVNDPEGLTIASALHSLEFEDVQTVRVGKIFTITLQSSTKKSAEQQVDEMCKRLLANPVIETYSFKIVKN
tara:strand:+ start:110 stop:364 length:255 start_codon:yes stop_codon:yes gene_type:complete